MKVAAERDVLNLIDALIDIEIQLARYYHVLTYFIPEQSDTWKTLSVQEASHGRLLEKIHRAAEEQPEQFSLGRFHEAAARIVADDVDDMRKRILCEEVTPQRAVSFILDVEDSVFECYAAEAVRTQDTAANEILGKLKAETVEHRRLLQTMVDG